MPATECRRMTNTQAWDRLASRGAVRRPSADTVQFGADLPDRGRPPALRRPQGQAGARPRVRRGRERGRDGPPGRARDRDRRLARRSSRSAASSPTAAEVRVEWHQGDAADLAFLRADSIDLALAAGVVARGRGPRPPLPPGAPRAARRARRSCSRTTTRCASRSGATTTSPAGSRSVASRSGAPTSTRRRSSRRATTSRSRCGRARSPTCSRRCTARATASTCCSSPSRCGRPIPARPFPRRRSGGRAKKAS